MQLSNKRTMRIGGMPALLSVIPALLFVLLASIFFMSVISESKLTLYRDSTYALILLLIFVSSITMFAIFSRRFGIIDILVFYFITISAAYSGLYQDIAGKFPWRRVHADSNMAYACIVYAVFTFSYLVGHFFGNFGRTPVTTPVMKTNKLYSYLLLMYFISIVCLIISAKSVFTPRFDESLSDGDAVEQIASIGKGLCLTTFLFVLALWKNTGRNTIFLLISGITTAVFFNPISNPRFMFVGAVIAIMAMFPRFGRPSAIAKATIIIVLFLANYLLLAPLKGLAESGSLQDAIGMIGNDVTDYAFRVDFDVMQVSANTVQYVSSVGVDYGYNLLGVALFWVPRAIWPNKPIASSVEVADYLGYNYVNLSSPLPAEFYFAGGLGGVVVLSCLLGYCIRRISKKSSSPYFGSQLTKSSIICAIIAGYTPILMRGSLNAVLPQMGFSLIAYIVLSSLASDSLKDKR